MKEMNIDALLADYMKHPKWAGKIFMQDEKTCYIDGLIAGAKAMQEENEQLNHIQHSIELQKQKQEMECNKMSSTIIEELKKKNEQLKAQIEKMKCCGNCKLRGAECVALEYQGILCGKTRDKWELAE